jgi:hypothetical protein
VLRGSTAERDAGNGAFDLDTSSIVADVSKLVADAEYSARAAAETPKEATDGNYLYDTTPCGADLEAELEMERVEAADGVLGGIGLTDQEEAAGAASQIQAIQRGKVARKELEELRVPAAAARCCPAAASDAARARRLRPLGCRRCSAASPRESAPRPPRCRRRRRPWARAR